MKIKDFKSGDKVEADLLIGKVTRGVTQTGAPYLSITLQDDSGEIEGKYWDVSPTIEALVEAGKVGNFKLDINQYRGALQARIHAVKILAPQEYELSDFVKASGYNKEFLKKEIQVLRDKIQDPVLHAIVEEAFDYYGEDFYEYPAATRNHHDFVGGLATHVYGMGQLALAICNLYSVYDEELLLAGVLLHDMGKIEEYTSAVLSEYTSLGKLVGHISIMHARIVAIAEKLGLENEEKVLMLRHMILSHHGEYEYGSPVLPLVKEAEMLNLIDNLDARTNMFEKVYDTLEEGSFSTRVFALSNRAFYKEGNNE